MSSLAAQAANAVDIPVPIPSTPATPHSRRFAGHSSRMQYRSRPVSVAVHPVSLVISECIAITSAIQKYARSPHTSVSAILGGSPNLVQLGPPSSAPRTRSKSSSATVPAAVEGTIDLGPANRWGLRGKKGKSMQDNPLISGFGRLRQELTGVKGKAS
jgi:brefeldin A-resistance guanine nucleotide exchange factor 1